MEIQMGEGNGNGGNRNGYGNGNRFFILVRVARYLGWQGYLDGPLVAKRRALTRGFPEAPDNTLELLPSVVQLRVRLLELIQHDRLGERVLAPDASEAVRLAEQPRRVDLRLPRRLDNPRGLVERMTNKNVNKC